MTLTIMSEVVQGTEEWHEQRRGIVTASVVGRLLTPTLKVASNDTSRALVRTLVAERITGWTDPQYVSDDMWRGTVDEPVARNLYAEHHAPVTEVGFMVREFDGIKLGYSPDGLVGDVGLIECKSRLQKEQLLTILTDEVPRSNMAQLQAGLLVSGRAWIDYVSFCAGMPLYVKRVFPDPEWQAALIEAVTAFEEEARTMLADYQHAAEGLPPTVRTNLDEIRI